MGRKSRLVRVTAPGLPPSPRLSLDPQRKRAVVRVRLATWRSWEWAGRFSTLVRWITNCLAVWKLWSWTPFAIQPIACVFGFMIGIGVILTVTQAVIPLALDGFLARQVFAVTSKVWFAPQAIAFRSRLYENGVVIPRHWEGMPVHVRFDISPDPDAAETVEVAQHARRPVRRSQRTAQILRLIVRTVDPNNAMLGPQHTGWMRSIPMIEIDQADAPRVTVVLSAAASLTAAKVSKPKTRTGGVDIDRV